MMKKTIIQALQVFCLLHGANLLYYILCGSFQWRPLPEGGWLCLVITILFLLLCCVLSYRSGRLERIGYLVGLAVYLLLPAAGVLLSSSFAATVFYWSSQPWTVFYDLLNLNSTLYISLFQTLLLGLLLIPWIMGRVCGSRRT